MIEPTVKVDAVGVKARATITIGRLELSATRDSAQAARRAVLAMYEDAVFGFNRAGARAVRERARRGSVSPDTRRRPP